MQAKEVTIHPVINGFVIDVGCKRFVFEKASKMLAELDRYFAHPEQVEKEYAKKYGFAVEAEPSPIAPEGEATQTASGMSISRLAMRRGY